MTKQPMTFEDFAAIALSWRDTLADPRLDARKAELARRIEQRARDAAELTATEGRRAEKRSRFEAADQAAGERIAAERGRLARDEVTIDAERAALDTAMEAEGRFLAGFDARMATIRQQVAEGVPLREAAAPLLARLNWGG